MVGLVFLFSGDGLVLSDNMRRICKEKVSHAWFCRTCPVTLGQTRIC